MSAVREGLTMERNELLDLMEEKVLVLTANVRLSRFLLGEYENRMLAAGVAAWSTPLVLPWQSWLQQCWEEVLLNSPEKAPAILRDYQAQLLWKQVLAEHPQVGLLSENALVRQLQSSWRLLRDWRLGLEDLTQDEHAEAAGFYELARAFEQACEKRHCRTEADLPALLAEKIASGVCSLPDEIVLLGFSVITPAQEHLLAILRAASVRVSRVRLKGKRGRASLYSFPDPQQELAMAVSWAREQLLKQPELSLGIVVPDLQHRYREVTHCLNKLLEPASLLPGQRSARAVWNLSLGRPLAEYAPVGAALGLLSLGHGALSLEEIEALLRSPHVAAGEDEILSRAWLIHRLRDTGQDCFSLSVLAHHARMHAGPYGEPRPWYCAELGMRLEAMSELRRETGSAPRSPSAWVDVFSRWLETAGWMTGVRLDSADYQVVERWKQLLGEFRALDDIASSLSAAEALRELQGMARDTLFQPKYPAAPLQVLGLFEATGLTFDKLWVMGMEESAWPAAPSPDPFIPMALQRERGMPGANPDRELELAREMLSGLEGAADEVLFSHALMDGAEELYPTPLLDHCQRRPAQEMKLAGADGWERQMLRQPVTEQLRDQGLPVAGSVRGGSSLFRHQSQCPFRAFAEHRLGARSFPGVHAGLDAAQRGSLLHRALEVFWKQTQDQQGLLALDDAALRSRIQLAASAALAEFEGYRPGLLGARGRDIEARRLQALMSAWMEKEKVRAPFHVSSTEQCFEGETQAIEYRLYVDRIDELEDGRQILIDYKTGRVSSSDWFGERPDDPQLPLYSTVLEPERVAGVVFARLRPDRTDFSGVVAGERLLPGLPSGGAALRQAMQDWPQVLLQWRETLDELAREFSEGRADVAPRKGKKTCDKSYCELMSLCRFHSQTEEEVEA
ncbi:PD-(D/E)XK nuclease family protein [Thiolapillus sp.]